MKIKVPFKHVASIEDNGIKRTFMYVDVTKIPKDIPMECNPRLQNMRSNVVKGIKQTLLEDDGLFHIFNRGITITAEDIEIKYLDNDAIIEITDIETQGCIDGGHTYKSIVDCQDNMIPDTQYVTVEVLAGKPVMNNFVKVAMARNKSQQVQNYSLAELDNAFDWIKDIIKDEQIEVSYKENTPGVSIVHIIWIMAVTNARFCKTVYSIRPNEAFNQYLSAMSEFGLDCENNPFYAAKDVLIDLIRMYDYVEVHFEDTVRKRLSNMKKVVKKGKFKSVIYGNEKMYKLPNQFVYPVFSSIREMLGVNESKLLYWKVEDPHEFLANILPTLVDMQLNCYQDNRNLLEYCRFKSAYGNLHDKVEGLVKDDIRERDYQEKLRELQSKS